MQGTDGWNKYYKIDKIVTPPYDTDGNTDWISNDEMKDIITIHAGVAEAYASWDVDVTTEDPGFDGLERWDLDWQVAPRRSSMLCTRAQHQC